MPRSLFAAGLPVGYRAVKHWGSKPAMSDPRHDPFSRLFSESGGALRRFVRRLVGSKETADEIVQEAFTRTYECSAIVKSPRAFLFSTARNLAADSRRHERVAKTDLVADVDSLLMAAPGESPEAALLAEERSQTLKQAVERLPPQCRAAFALKLFYGYSYKEIADQLGISPKTVENQIARGLRDTHAYLRRHYRQTNP